MSFTIGDRVVYHGWRGDTGEGTVIAIRPNWIRVKRDFSADDGVWFRPSELASKSNTTDELSAAPLLVGRAEAAMG